ncbi:MAG: DUF6320 domain-containing protein [Christensenellales bacterium]|jgi:hypothetical protein
MSYCVNCGVELDKSLKRCPLCQTPVINPARPLEPVGAAPPYPARMAITVPKNTARVVAAGVSLLLLLPVLICLVVDYAIAGNPTWSWYVAGGIGLFWVVAVLPFLWKHGHPVFTIALDAASLWLFLALVEWASGTGGWFWPIAFPVTLVVALLAGVIYALLRRGRIQGLDAAAAVLLALGLLCMALEVLLNAYFARPMWPRWSLIPLAALGSLAVVCLVLSRNDRLRSELSRRLHF